MDIMDLYFDKELIMSNTILVIAGVIIVLSAPTLVDLTREMVKFIDRQ
jgi:hypothetical protein